jgi:beta-glucanase (GH16 family)
VFVYIHTLPAGELTAENFHVFEIEWSPSQIIGRVDGVTMGQLDLDEYDEEFRLEQYLIFNISVGGWFTDEPDDSTEFPQYMYIDWVRHYTN